MTALHTALRAACRAAVRACPAAAAGRGCWAGTAPGSASVPRCDARVRAVRPGRVCLRRLADAGMTTAEYAVGTLAACAFAAVLIAVVRSGAIKSALSGLITSALSIAS